MSEDGSSFKDKRLSRRDFLKLTGAGMTSAALMAAETYIGPAFAQTEKTPEKAHETLDDLISRDPAILGGINFTEAAQAGQLATVSSDNLPMNYPDMPITVSESYDDKFRKRPDNGISLIRSAKTGAEIAAVHSALGNKNLPLPGEGWRAATEGGHMAGYLGPTQISRAMQEMINRNGTFTLGVGDRKEILQPAGVALYPPGKDGRPTLEGEILDYLFRDGDKDTLKLMFCGTIAPFTIREITDELKDTSDMTLKAAREILLDPKSDAKAVRGMITDVVYPILYKNNPQRAQELLVKSTRHVRETGDTNEPLRFVKKEELESRFGVPLEKFYGSTYVWTFKRSK